MKTIAMAVMGLLALTARAGHCETGDRRCLPAPISAALQPYIDKRILAGAVCLVADKDKVITIQTAGSADISAGKQMRRDTEFWIASMTKSVTAAAVMVLLDEGKIKLDDPVSKYLPEFNDIWLTAEQDGDHQLLRRPRHPVTIFNLLTHTSGYPNIIPETDPASQSNKDTLLPLWAESRCLAATPLNFEPGSKWRYSSAGYDVLGRVIEATSGEPYSQFIQEKILNPIGMTATTFSPNRKLLGKLAKSYLPTADKKDLMETPLPIFEYPLTPKSRIALPSGGLFSTATDMMRFCQMLLNGGVSRGHRVLSESSAAAMTAKEAATDDGQGYGFGLFANGDGSFGHNGAYGTIMTVYPAKNLIVILLMQHATIQREGFGEIYGVTTLAVMRDYAKASSN